MVLNHFANIDLLILVLYFVLVMGVGFYVSRHKDESSGQYFLAGRNVGWFAVGASLFATNISGEHFIGLAGSGASNGLVVGHFEWLGAIAVIILGWVFVPVYLKAGVFTIPEYLELRFNKASRMYLTSVSIVAYILTKLSVTLFAGGILMNALLGWDIYTSTVLMVVLTGIYTIIGGLGAVIYTQVVQFIFLIAGSLFLTVAGLNEVGGLSGLKASLPAGHFDIFKPFSDPEFPWTGIVFGAPIIAIWYWCTDQYIVQRLLGAKSISAAKKATVFTSLLKLLPVLLWVVPGMIALALFPEVAGDNAYPALLASSLLPAGIKGLVLASVLAALMSSLASIFNSTSTLYVMDYYKYYHPEASERKLVLAGRLSTMIIVISAILWVPLTKLISSSIYIYLQSVQAYIGPPIAAVFILGIMTKSVNSYGAIWGLIIGGIIGALRLISELLFSAYELKNTIFSWFIEINFLHFAVILFLLSLTIILLVSKMYEARFAGEMQGQVPVRMKKYNEQPMPNLGFKNIHYKN